MFPCLSERFSATTFAEGEIFIILSSAMKTEYFLQGLVYHWAWVNIFPNIILPHTRFWIAHGSSRCISWPNHISDLRAEKSEQSLWRTKVLVFTHFWIVTEMFKISPQKFYLISRGIWWVSILTVGKCIQYILHTFELVGKSLKASFPSSSWSLFCCAQKS